MVLVKSCIGVPTLCICTGRSVGAMYLKSEISRLTGLSEDFSLYLNGRHLTSDQVIPEDGVVLITLPLPGGKGGFGSMLRAIGAQIEKTTNREACRDLSGRRLRDINEEQRLKKWISKQKEREEAAAHRKKERLERLRSVPKHEFHDSEYDKQRSELPERIHDALSEGLQKTPAVEAGIKKRKGPDAAQSSKKQCLWLGIDPPSESDASVSDSDSESSGDSMRNNPPESISQEDSMSSTNNSSVEMMDGPVSSLSSETDSTSCSTEESSTTSTVEKQEVGESDCDVKLSDLPTNLASASGESTVQGDCNDNTSEVKYKLEEVSSKLRIEEDNTDLDLLRYSDPKELEELGLEKLKNSLMELGLKCGGTLQERAQRLWAIRGLKPEEFPSTLLAKSSKSKKS